jgi:hypothetical protein
MAGYVRLHRQIQTHWVWDGPACPGRAWMDLVMLAAYAPHTVSIKGEPVVLGRGDLAASVRFLAQRWKWGLGKTAKFLRALEVDRMLFKKRNGSGNGSPSVFSIVNYDIYQTDDPPERNGSGNASGTVAERSRTETKKVKKVNKEPSPGLETNSAQEPHPGQDLTFDGYLKRFQPEGQQILRQTVAAIATTRKSGRIASSVVNRLAQELAGYPDTVVLRSCRTYLTRDYAGEGRDERYLLGIVRGEAKRGSVNGTGVPHAETKTPGQLAIERAIRAEQAELEADLAR